MTVRIIAIITCLAVILALCPCAHSQADVQCGDELRIEKHDGTIFQGELRWNTGDQLCLRNGKYGWQTISLSDVKTVSYVKRNTATWTMLGAAVGTGLGLAAAKAENKNRESEGFLEFGVVESVLITLLGAAAGSAVGAYIGQSDQMLHEIPLEELPICPSFSGDTFPIKVSFVINF